MCLGTPTALRGVPAGINAPHLRQPEVKVLDAGVEVLLLVGFLQLLALLCRLVDQKLPLFIQSAEPGLQEDAALRLSSQQTAPPSCRGLSLVHLTAAILKLRGII